MSAPPGCSTRNRRLLWCLGLTLAYIALGRLSYALSAMPTIGAAALWLPCGISVAAILLLGRWIWPGVFLGAWILNQFVMGGSPTLALPFAVGNTLEAVAAGHLFNRYALVRRYLRNRREFRRPGVQHSLRQ